MIPFVETVNSKEELLRIAIDGYRLFSQKKVSKNDFLMYFGFTHGEAITKFYASNTYQVLLDAGFHTGSEAYFSAGINAWKNLKAGTYTFPPFIVAPAKSSKSRLLPLQQIFYGAPGTGKSRKVKDITERVYTEKEERDKFVFRTTFHPDYDYASFVGCYKPTNVQKNVTTGFPEIVDYNLTVEQLADIYEDLVLKQYPSALGVGRYLYSVKYWKCFSSKYGKVKAQDVIDKVPGETSTAGRDCINGTVNFYEELEKISSLYKTEIAYRFIPQVFTNAYVKAWNEMKNEAPKSVYLVIEEINRGNCAQIFGDLFQLLDRNDGGFSEYPIDIDDDLKNYFIEKLGSDSEGVKDGKMCLPPNLNIWATMNTSDQSLFPMDSAFKRRWEWEYVPIRYSKNEARDANDKFHEFKIEIGGKQYLWVDFLKKVNEKILAVTDSEDKQMGEYFIKKDVDEKTFINKVMYYLWSEVGKDLYNSSQPFFVFSDGTKDSEGRDKKEFSFNELFRDNATALLKGFMKNLEVESLKSAESPKEEETMATPEE